MHLPRAPSSRSVNFRLNNSNCRSFFCNWSRSTRMRRCKLYTADVCLRNGKMKISTAESLVDSSLPLWLECHGRSVRAVISTNENVDADEVPKCECGLFPRRACPASRRACDGSHDGRWPSVRHVLEVIRPEVMCRHLVLADHCNRSSPSPAPVEPNTRRAAKCNENENPMRVPAARFTDRHMFTPQVIQFVTRFFEAFFDGCLL